MRRVYDGCGVVLMVSMALWWRQRPAAYHVRCRIGVYVVADFYCRTNPGPGRVIRPWYEEQTQEELKSLIARPEGTLHAFVNSAK